MSERFYINEPLSKGLVTLEGPEAHHLAVVCRLRPGDQVTLFNGDGREYPARLVDASRRQVSLEVADPQAPQRELPISLELAAPLPKGDRAQFLVEKLTELGVTTFVPLACQRSIIHPREGRLDKLQRYVIEASKQCGRNVLMDITPLMEWRDYCRQEKIGWQSLLAHPDKEDQTGTLAGAEKIHQLPQTISIRLAVGPEGGFTDEEVVLAATSGWQLINLGPRILRMETAALVLAAWVIQRI